MILSKVMYPRSSSQCEHKQNLCPGHSSLNVTLDLDTFSHNCRTEQFRSSGGVVVKLLACGARGPGFDSRSSRYDFRDWLSPASKSRNIAKATYQPTNH